MRPVLSRAQMQAFDRRHIEAGVPGVVLMENAGRGAAHLIGLKARPRSASTHQVPEALRGSCIRCADERSLADVTFLVLCGAGNNGGDGFVVARHLLGRGAKVRTLSMVPLEQFKGDARLSLDALRGVGGSVEVLGFSDQHPRLFDGVDLIVDALLGTGADRLIEGELRSLIVAVNESSIPTIALDIPSGLDADRGCVLGVCIHATHTVAFAHLKRGLLTTAGHEHSGAITVSHIGVPSHLSEGEGPAAWLLELDDLKSRIPKRSPTSHKGRAGRVCVIAGSPGMTGAARLVGHASLRAGAGLVTLCGSADMARSLDSEVVELMTHQWGEGDAAFFATSDAIVIGPGLGRDPALTPHIELALQAQRPTVLDADALRWLADAGRQTLQERGPGGLAVLTPHPGEAAALLAISVAEVESDRFLTAQSLADSYRATVVLKGSRTIVATPGKAPAVCAFGSAALATAGSGDVLSGILGALLVGADSAELVFERTQLAVGLHALAGESWSLEQGSRGLLAAEIADKIPAILHDLEQR